jgi:hypothetical protein
VSTTGSLEIDLEPFARREGGQLITCGSRPSTPPGTFPVRS